MSKIKKWPSLDVLRGLAVICMLLNHAAAKLLTDDAMFTGLSGWFNFMGSFAPVLFFFATGIGYGLAHEVGRTANTKDVLIKASILIVADIFMRGGDFTLMGWDFLAFIAFSMILLHGFRGRRFGLSGALGLILVLLFVRYGLGAYYDRAVDLDEQKYWVLVVLGRTALDNVSYWFTPWFAYPLVGFILGALGRKHGEWVMSHIGKISLLAFGSGLFIAAASTVLWMKGAAAFRWGTVSFNFFIASVACVLVSLAISWLIADKLKHRRLTQLLSMQGVSSLAVVPIHYFYLKIFIMFFAVKISGTVYLIAMPFWIAFCFISARLTNQLTLRLTSSNSKTLLLTFVSIVAGCSIVTTMLSASANPAFAWIVVITFAAQYLLCILLGFSYTKR